MSYPEVPPDGYKPRPDGPDLSHENIEALFRAAAELTDELDEQVALVTLCVSARWDANQLRRRTLIGGLIPHRPPHAVEYVKIHATKNIGRRMGGRAKVQ